VRTAAPSLVFAVIGQARSDGAITPQEESEVLDRALRHWALQTSIETAASYGLPRGTRLGRRTQTTSYRPHTTY
jgi:hypothetical protein